MKTRSILSLAVFVLLLALLLALSACHGKASSNSQFGGAFSFGGERMDGVLIGFEKEKKEDFRCYKELGLSLSQAVKLDDVLFKKSITQNKNLPYGDKRQQYNYVILQDEIIVAEWTATAGADLQIVLAGAKNVDKECKDRQCLGVGDSGSKATKKVMVNFFTENKKAGPRSPCWLDSNEKKDGLLDAISKYLMLAQGKGTTIDKYVPEWTSEDVKVAYAGEFIVDLVSCTYSLNNDSGTYGPHAGTLAVVAKHFAKEIDVGPNLYVDVVFDVDTKTKSSVSHSTDNLFETTTKISNCP